MLRRGSGRKRISHVSCVFENKVENDVPARYAVRVPVIQIAGNRVVPRNHSSLEQGWMVPFLMSEIV